MTLATRLVRVTLTDPDGAAVATASIRAELTAYEVDGSIIVPRLVYGQTDVNGTCLLHLWPNERGTAGSQYRITVVKSAALLLNTTATIPIGDPATEVLLQTVINAAPYPAVNVAAQAVIDAQALVDTATTLKDQTQVLHDVVVAMSTAINAVNADLANINAVAADLANVDLAAGSIASVNTVATSVANVNIVAADIANINSVATDHANIDTVAGVHADVTTVAGISGNVTTVAGVAANVTTVAGISSAVSTVAAANANISAVAADLTNLNAVATDLIALNAVAVDLTALNAVNADRTNIDNVAADLANINTAAAATTNINTVATNVANVNTVAGISANVTTVAGISANVTSVAGIAAAVTTNATNITAIQGAAANAAAVASDKAIVIADMNTVAADKATVIADMNTTAADRATTTAARDAAIAAWAASMSPAETLPAFAASLHYGAVVKAIIYDTSKDSDGGAWRKRCADKSWYTETLGGSRWIGQRASNAAAWTAAGSATGAVYQSTADGKFYTPTASGAQTEVFRGISREFPEQALIVAETGRVVIYDGASVGCPMWMVFIRTTNSHVKDFWRDARDLSSIFALGGTIAFSINTVSASNVAGVSRINFISDKLIRQSSVVDTQGCGTGDAISKRNSNTQLPIGNDLPNIVNASCNDIALTVLDTAPIDPATGLPVPTIFVGTSGGLSTITNAGTVTNSTSTTSVVSVAAKGKTLTSVRSDGTVCVYNDVTTMAVAPDKTYTASSIPATLGTASKASPTKAVGSTLGLSILKDNPATPANGMEAFVTNTWTSGYQIGDSRGAYLADTVVETVTGATPLSDDFSTYADDTALNAVWASGTSLTATAALVAGEMQVTATANFGRKRRDFTTVVGKTYVVAASYRLISGSGYAYVSINLSAGDGDGVSLGSNATSTAVNPSITFIATATTTRVLCSCNTNGAVGGFDNISVKLAEPDRSVKGKGLVVNGSLTKTAVASAAALVAYSGFSAANYLEQPYNSDLDFGMGDFCVMGWFTTGSNVTTTQFVFVRSDADSAPRFIMYISSGVLSLGTENDAGVNSDISSVVSASTNYFLCAGRNTSGLFLYLNAVSNVSASTTPTVARNITSISLAAVLRIGADLSGTYYFRGTNLALWRITATAPTADQIAQIYREELPLFQASAQCTIGGSSTAVTALASDDVTDLLHVGTSIGRSEFKGLLRTNYEATPAGAITSLSANQGAVITGGTSGYFYQPAFLLRDELRRCDEARKALGKVPVCFDFDAVTSQVAFVLPKGYTTKAVYSAGTLKRLGATKDYTTGTDGYQETVTFGTAPGNTVWVSVMATRNY